jgi:16S rRNA (guanine966-N2)-methyltransferase
MRIVAGKWRSRQLRRPPERVTRPMPDRVREAIFSALGAIYACPGRLPPLIVADVFAGSGSMGLEALSRGAAACWFYERNREALTVLYQNLETLGVQSEGTVVTQDAWSAAFCTPERQPYDLILLDPPYADTKDASSGGLVRRYLRKEVFSAVDGPVIVLHHPASVDYGGVVEDGWRLAHHREYGTNAISIFKR